MNAGDVFVNELALSYFAKHADESKSIIYSDIYLKDKHGKRTLKQQRNFKELGCFIQICHQSILFNKSKLEEEAFNPSYRLSADFDLLLELYLEGDKDFAKKIDVPLVIYKQGGRSDQQLHVVHQERIKQFKHRLKNPLSRWWNLLNLKRQQAKLKRHGKLYI